MVETIALAEGIIQRVIDRIGQDAVARCDFALDRDVEHRPALSWSVVTSVMPGSALILSKNSADQCWSSPGSASFKVYWNCVLFSRAPMVMSCAGCI